MSELLAITRASLACPLGLCRRPAVATMRSGLVVFETDDVFEDLTVSRTSTLPSELTRIDRIAQLLTHVLHELTASECKDWHEPLPVFVVLPTLEFVTLDRLLASIRTDLEQRTGTKVLLTHESVIPDSRAGIFTALRWAAQVLAEGRFPRIALLAADSLVAYETIQQLEASGLVLGPGNRDGRILGEGAAGLVVERPGVSTRKVRLASVGAVNDLSGRDSFDRIQAGQQLDCAESLTELFAWLAASFPQRTDLVVSGQPSESYWAREFSYAYLRNVELMPEPLQFIQTGAEIGDAGAAAGAVALVRGLSEFEPSPWRVAPKSVLAYAIADHGHAGAALLSP